MKAETWAVEVPAADTSHMETPTQDIAQYDEEIGALQRRHGALTERAAERQRLLKRMAETTRIAGEHEARQNAVKECQSKLDEIVAEEHQIREALEKAQASLTIESHAVQGSFFHCPACGESLVYSRGECKVGEPVAADVSREIEVATGHVKELKLALTEVTNRKFISDGLAVEAVNAVGQAQAATAALADLADVHDGDTARDDGIDAQITGATAARTSAQESLDRLEAAAHAYNEALAKTSRARAIHEEIKAVITLAADLAPDGLPGELLARAMRPINERLRDSAAMAGWSSVSITADEILVHGRHWDLASRSECWRAQAMIGAAIAQLSGIKCLVLDELDVLEPALRSGAIAWLAEIAEDFDTIVVMATLKAPPQNLPGAIQSVWLEENEPAGHALSRQS